MQQIGAAHFKNGFSYGTNTGDGVVDGLQAIFTAPTETWTLTCTVSQATGSTFSVVGSVSGGVADLTSGTAYDNGIISLTLTDGATAWAVGDTITLDIVRDITEFKLLTSVDTVQVDFTGDLVSCDYSLKGNIAKDTTFTIHTHTLSAGEIAEGGACYPVTETKTYKVELKVIDLVVTTEATVNFLIK